LAKILVVDDEEAVRSLIRRILQIDGHDVYFAIDGWRGLVVWNDNDFDLIILDMKMPRISGTEMLQAIRDAGDDIKVVFCSADVAPGILPKGANGAVKKPFGINELMDEVNRVLAI